MHQVQAPDPIPTEQKSRGGYRYRSLFWAFVLIGVGVVWLLYNFDVVSVANLSMLIVLWPILLVGIGVDMLVGRRSYALGGTVGVVTVGLIIVLMLVGPSLGWAGDTDLRTERFSTSVGQATSARIALETGRYSATVHALAASTASDRSLLDAELTFRGEIAFESSGVPAKDVSIEPSEDSWWWGWLDLDDAAPWSIGLDPGTPLSLSVDSSSGSNDLDLAGLNLRDLEIDMSSGSTRVALPALGTRGYNVGLDLSSGDIDVQAADGARFDLSIDMSSGDVRVTVGQESDVTVRFDSSSGKFTLDLAANQALRVEVRDVSSGDVKLPSELVQIAGGEGEEGTWETQGYSTASHKVHVIIDSMSSGSVTIRQGS